MPNLKNLGHVFNLRRGSNIVGSPEIVFIVTIFEPALNWNWFLPVQRRGFNSLNSVSAIFDQMLIMTTIFQVNKNKILLHVTFF